jgi:protein O-GlcNAc transferase
VTKLGQGFAARVAGSLLNAIDLPELITKSKEEYESLALDLASNPTRLQHIKDKLAKNRDTTALFNIKLFTRHLEEAYQSIYQRYFDELKPDTIYVNDQVPTRAILARKATQRRNVPSIGTIIS